jgi:putative transposase
MKKNRFTDEQIVAILREGEKGDLTIEQVCRSHGIGTSVFYRWRKQFGTGGSAMSEGRRVKELEGENARLKKALAERVLEIEVLKEINAKKW